MDLFTRPATTTQMHIVYNQIPWHRVIALLKVTNNVLTSVDNGNAVILALLG